jgi:hypothetical protein
MLIRQRRRVGFAGLKQVTHGLKLPVADRSGSVSETHLSAWRRSRARLSVEVMPAITVATCNAPSRLPARV